MERTTGLPGTRKTFCRRGQSARIAAVRNSPKKRIFSMSGSNRALLSRHISTGYKGRAPFNAVLTHGFTIDDKGKKMSKSLGNVIDPQDVVKRYGADVLRLWVASTDFRNDMAASEKILKQVQEAYTKIRNTCRFLLSNLNDFPSQFLVPSPQSL